MDDFGLDVGCVGQQVIEDVDVFVYVIGNEVVEQCYVFVGYMVVVDVVVVVVVDVVF